MPRMFEVKNRLGVATGYFFDCPGCKMGHFLTVCPYRDANGDCWEFGGDIDFPTFSPDVVSRFVHPHEHTESLCHFFLDRGIFYFLSDSTHSLSGRIVRMKNLGQKT